MKRLRLLELFCKAGGAGTGYDRAGFDVVGVDIEPQPRYPFEFVQADALAYVAKHGHEFDAIHASPPCQHYAHITPDKSIHPDLIATARFYLIMSGKPYVIENVAAARKHLINPVMLCGAAFGLKVYRHRYFECNFAVDVPEHEPHNDSVPSAGHRVFRDGEWTYLSPKGFISVAGHVGNVPYVRFAMGIDWMTQGELAEAIPPAYTQYIGQQLQRHLTAETA